MAARGRELVVARLAKDPNDRLVVAGKSLHDRPFFIQWPQTFPAISWRDLWALLGEGVLVEDRTPVQQRWGGLADDAVAWHIRSGDRVFALAERIAGDA
jgi:hypothetical protein